MTREVVSASTGLDQSGGIGSFDEPEFVEEVEPEEPVVTVSSEFVANPGGPESNNEVPVVVVVPPPPETPNSDPTAEADTGALFRPMTGARKKFAGLLAVTLTAATPAIALLVKVLDA